MAFKPKAWIVIFFFLNLNTGEAVKIPDLNADCYGIGGDVNLALLSGFSDRGEDKLCQLEPQPWLSLFFQFYQGFTFAIETINNSSDILPNITLGYVIMDTCWTDLAALGQAMQLFKIPQTEMDGVGENSFSSSHTRYTARKHSSISKQMPENTTKTEETNFFTCFDEDLDLDIVGVVGPGSSAESLMIGGMATVLKVPVLATLATNDELSDKSRFGFFTRMVSPDKFQVETILNFLSHFNWTYVSLIYSEGAYGENAAKIIHKDVKKYNICLQISEMIPSEMSVLDADAVTQKLMSHTKARVIIAFIQQSQMSLILNELTNKDIAKHFIWITGDSLADADLGEAASGAFVVNYRVNSIPEFDQYYLSLTPSQMPDNPWIKYLWQMFYDCSWEVDPGRNSCSNFADVPKRDQFTSSSASLYVDGAFAYAHALDTLIRAHCPTAFNDKSKLAACVTGPLLLSYLRETRFMGYSGEVSFDEYGDRLGKYHVKQYRANSQSPYRVVAEFDKQSDLFVVLEKDVDWGLFIEGERQEPLESVCSKECDKRQYAVRGELSCCWECRYCRSNERLVMNGTFDKCEECPELTWPDDDEGTSCEVIEPDYLQWNSVPTLIFCVLGFTLFLFTLITISWIIHNRNIKLIKASSRQLIIVILLGIMLAVATSILMLVLPVTGVCQATTIGFHLSVGMIFVPLLVKTSRIYRIFTSSLKGIKNPTLISNRAVNMLTAAVLFLQMLMITVSSLTSPTLAREKMPVRTEKKVELFCDVRLTGLLPPLAFNLVIILSCAILGFLTRRLPQNFNESWYIFVAVSTTLFTWLIFLPTYFTAKNAVYRVILLISSLLLNGSITLVCLFVPKVYAVYFYDENLLKYIQSQAPGPSTVHDTATSSYSVKRVIVAPALSSPNDDPNSLHPANVNPHVAASIEGDHGSAE